MDGKMSLIYIPNCQCASGHVVRAKKFSARSPRIRHRSELTEKAWENAIQGLGNIPTKSFCLHLTPITFNLLIWTAVLSLFVSLFLFFTVSDLTLKAAKFRECTVKSL